MIIAKITSAKLSSNKSVNKITFIVLLVMQSSFMTLLAILVWSQMTTVLMDDTFVQDIMNNTCPPCVISWLQLRWQKRELKMSWGKIGQGLEVVKTIAGRIENWINWHCTWSFCWCMYLTQCVDSIHLLQLE